MLIILFVLSQLSPGDLHEAHKSLEGVKNCSVCHKIGSKDFKKQCLSCHSLIKESIEKSTGYHGNLQELACQKCHKDHFGRAFKMVHWPEDMASFDHDLTGYPLRGSHKSISCRACHKKEFLQDPKPLTLAGKNLNTTFLGLSTTCAGCHQDVHLDKLGNQCSNCHQEKDWRPARDFDHQKTDFVLVGLHNDVSCSKCHSDYKPESGPVLADRLSFSACSNCHKDQHLNQFSEDCSKCHDSFGWNPARKFKHSMTRFALTGKHKNTSCSSCHKASGSDRKYVNIPSDSCVRCHQDPHEARLEGDCSSCHSTQDWRKIKNNQFDHASTRYPLIEQHRGVACESCHKRNGAKRAVLRFDRCERCHQDPHKNEFATFESGTCERCHSESGFIPAKFGFADHAKTSFPIKGSHLAIPCMACHKPVSGEITKFQYAIKTCDACHQNPHNPMDQVSFTIKCEDCHSEDNWYQMDFNHDRTHFSLKGAHLKSKCQSCHTDKGDSWNISRQDATTGNLFHCVTCHEDPHLSQLSQNCVNCHTENHWKPDNFDHQKTAFPLDGAHISISCNDCHKKKRSSQIITYKPLDTACQACH